MSDFLYDSNEYLKWVDRVRTCYIMYDKYAVGELIHEYSSLHGEEEWLIKPYWSEIDRLGWRAGIPGIDDQKRLEVYIRHYEPILVSQRVPPIGRRDLNDYWLPRLHMKEYDKFEFMCRSHSATGNNKLYISRTSDKIIDVDNPKFPMDIPDFDTDSYGWLEDYIRKD